jgi:hypothetical protein
MRCCGPVLAGNEIEAGFSTQLKTALSSSQTVLLEESPVKHVEW